MEFLRFGSSIPGSYWGCCAADIIQNFKIHPDTKMSIQLVGGDGNAPIRHPKGGSKFLAGTAEEVFLQRLRVGTHNGRDMPNHAFFAILTASQISGDIGKAWLKILKREGFEFLRTVDNSVYSGPTPLSKADAKGSNPHCNYVFALFRNVGNATVPDQYVPPKAWTDLEQVVPETWEHLDTKAMSDKQREVQLPLFNNLPKVTGNEWTEEQVEKAGITVTYAGIRPKLKQQSKADREKWLKAEGKDAPTKTAPFAASK